MIDIPANDIVEFFTKRAENYLRERKESGALDPRDGGPMVFVFPPAADWDPNGESTFEDHQAAHRAEKRLLVMQCYSPAMAGNAEAIAIMNGVALEAYCSTEMREAMPPELFDYVRKRLSGDIQIKKNGKKKGRYLWRDYSIACVVYDVHMLLSHRLGRYAYFTENDAKKADRFADVPPVASIVRAALARVDVVMGESYINKMWKSNQTLATWNWLLSLQEFDRIGSAPGNQPLWTQGNPHLGLELHRLHSDPSNIVGRTAPRSFQ